MQQGLGGTWHLAAPVTQSSRSAQRRQRWDHECLHHISRVSCRVTSRSLPDCWWWEELGEQVQGKVLTLRGLTEHFCSVASHLLLHAFLSRHFWEGKSFWLKSLRKCSFCFEPYRRLTGLFARCYFLENTEDFCNRGKRFQIANYLVLKNRAFHLRGIWSLSLFMAHLRRLC